MPNQPPVNLDVSYSWDNEGRMTLLQYPGDQGQSVTQGYTPGATYSYDAMGRPNSMVQCTPTGGQGCFFSTSSAAWGPAGELLSFGGDTRTYNNLGQLTHIAAGSMDVQYVYPAGQNNGRITQMIDGVTGETVNYTYDALSRVTAAATTNGLWGQSYTYDGWGNLTGKTVTQGTGPAYSQAYDPSLNQPVGSNPPSTIPPYYTDTTDVENRPLRGTGISSSARRGAMSLPCSRTTGLESGCSRMGRTRPT